jgi:NAD dependent epimerase/dehydratase family enzyme
MIKPKTFISASAIGIYGLESEGVKDEKDITNTDWISRMAIDWEKSADIFKKINTKVVKMRISLIISKKSLFLKSYLLSMRFGIATLLGSKSRHISWIHIDDAVNFIDLAINNKKYNGAYNLATSKCLTQGKLVQIIKEEKYPFCITFQIPAQILSFVLGKRSKIFMPNLVAKADKLKKLDFKYKYDSFRKVIRSL